MTHELHWVCRECLDGRDVEIYTIGKLTGHCDLCEHCQRGFDTEQLVAVSSDVLKSL